MNTVLLTTGNASTKKEISIHTKKKPNDIPQKHFYEFFFMWGIQGQLQNDFELTCLSVWLDFL